MAAVRPFPIESQMCPPEHCKSADDNPAFYSLAGSSWGGWEASAAAYGDLGSTTTSTSPSDVLADSSKQMISDTDPLSGWLSSFRAQPATHSDTVEKLHTPENSYSRLMLGAADFNLVLSSSISERLDLPSEKPVSEFLSEKSLESGSESSLIDPCTDFVQEDCVRSSASSSQTVLAIANQTPLPFARSSSVIANVNTSTHGTESSPNTSMESPTIASNISLPQCLMADTPTSYMGAIWNHHNSGAIDAWGTYLSTNSTSSNDCGQLTVTRGMNLTGSSSIRKQFGVLDQLIMPEQRMQQQADSLIHRTGAHFPFREDHMASFVIAPNVAEYPQLQLRNRAQQLDKADAVSSVSTEEEALPRSASGIKLAVQTQERKACDKPGKRQRPEPIPDREAPPLKQQCNASPFSQESTNLDHKSEEKPINLALTTTASSYNSETAAVGPALNTNGKPRARRGSATDPQSVYARHRRERINERLKILQNLVPNGAKVDIVTMLEEAINYVKFLQLQVKLLSSDDYWMYAPTTYNGIDVSFDMHIGLQSTT